MKKFLCLSVFCMFVSCMVTSQNNYTEDAANKTRGGEVQISYIEMPEEVITVNGALQAEEIIFTEDETQNVFQDPTEYGSLVFSAVYVPEN